MTGTKETMEVIVFVDDVAAALKAAKADGVIDWRDALRPETRAMIPAMLNAARGGELIPAEAKSWTPEQISDLLLKVGEALGHLVEAVVS